MAWWQIALAAWGLGAFAAFPLAFEYSLRLDADDGRQLRAPAVLVVAIMAASWPAAWLALVVYAAAGVGVRRG
jgi:hypothetical protein